MALPQKVLEQLGREPPKTPGWASQFLMFSGTIFLISIFVYFGIVFGYRPYMVSESNKLEDKINTFSQQVSAEEQDKVVGFYSQLLNLRSLFSTHIISSQLFDWLDENTQVRVYFDKLDLNTKTGDIRLGGLAKTMEDANQQFAIFTSRPEVARVNISSVSFSNNLWRFDVTLTFREGYFQGLNKIQQ